MCSESVEITPNVLWCEDMKMSCRHLLWQVQSFVLVGGVEESKLNFRGRRRESATFGGGECRSAVGIGASVSVVLRGWDCEAAWQGCLMCLL